MSYLHEELQEWLRENKIHWQDLSKDVGVTNLTHYTKGDGKPFKLEWIKTWQEKYGWSDDQAFTFAFGRYYHGDPEMYKTPHERKILSAVKYFSEIFEEVRNAG